MCGGTQTEHRHSTYCTDRAAAKTVACEWERASADPHHASSHTTIEVAARRFLAESETQRLAAGTINMYACKVGHVVRVFGRDCSMASVDAGAVDRYIDARKGEGASSSTVYKELVTLRGILRSAARRGEYGRDPRLVMPLKFHTGYKPRRRYLTLRELERLCKELAPRRAAAVLFLAATGARLGEFRRASKGCVTDRSVWLLTSKTAGRGREPVPREVPITDVTRPLLAIAISAADGEEQALFSSWPWIHREMRRAAVKAGLEHVTPNDLRRTFASLHLQAGASEEHVGRALGHASTDMVRRVYGVVEGKALGALMQGAGCPSVVKARVNVEKEQKKQGGPSATRTRSQRIKSPIAGDETIGPFAGLSARCPSCAGSDVADGLTVGVRKCRTCGAVWRHIVDEFPDEQDVLEGIASCARIGRLGELTGDRDVVINMLSALAFRLGMPLDPRDVDHARAFGVARKSTPTEPAPPSEPAKVAT